jgi:hypothetical protein
MSLHLVIRLMLMLQHLELIRPIEIYQNRNHKIDQQDQFFHKV